MAEVKAKTIDTWKLKKWWPILAPKSLRNAFLGETPAQEISSLVGRTAEINLATIMNDIRKQSTNITFKIISTDGANAHTEAIKFEMSPSYVKRQVRSERERIDDSFLCKTSDGKNVRIKPFLITRAKIKGSQATLLRKLARMTLKEAISKMSYDQLLSELVMGKIQKNLSIVLRKVVSLKTCDIRMMELVEEVKAGKAEEKPVVVEQPAAPEKAETEEMKEEEIEVS